MAQIISTDTTVARSALKKWMTFLGPFAGLFLVIVVFAILTGNPEKYLSPFNIRVILSQTVIVAVSAIGMTLIIISGGIDLSVGSVIALTGVVTALGVNAGFEPIVAVFAGIAVGGMVGFVNGSIITGLKVVPFIATLGMLGIARGAAKWIAHQEPVNVSQTWINDLVVTFPDPPWLMLAAGVWITIVLAIVMAIVLRNTVFGRRVFALGSNEAAARACGISTDRLRIWIYSIAGLFFGLSGVLQMSRLRQGDPTVAAGTELDVIAAVVIGGGSLNGGQGTVLGAMIGALIMAFLRNGCQQMGWANYVQEIIIGSIIIIAVAIDQLRGRRSSN
jgi:ribose transport system permease protein